MSTIGKFINSEQAIGIKLLSDADLGRSPLSNQTHIGLSIKTLTFLQNGEIVDNAHFLYRSQTSTLCCNFDLITRGNGRLDAPKIRKGFFGDSIVDEIRRLCYDDPGYDWYLLWFGLKDNELVFWLVREDSDDYELLSPILPSKMKVYIPNNREYSYIIDAIRKKLETISLV